MYEEVKALERQVEFLKIQEEYVKDEQRALKRELVRAKEEIKRIQSVPLLIGQFLELIDENYGIASSTSGATICVRVLSTIDRQLLTTNASVAMHRYVTCSQSSFP